MSKLILKAIVPYVDGIGNKPRPVVQLNQPLDEYNNFQVAFITSQKPIVVLPTDIEINSNHKFFTKTGLNKTSYIRASKIFTLDPSSIENIIGDLPDDLTYLLNDSLKISLNLQ